VQAQAILRDLSGVVQKMFDDGYHGEVLLHRDATKEDFGPDHRMWWDKLAWNRARHVLERLQSLGAPRGILSARVVDAAAPGVCVVFSPANGEVTSDESISSGRRVSGSASISSSSGWSGSRQDVANPRRMRGWRPPSIPDRSVDLQEPAPSASSSSRAAVFPERSCGADLPVLAMPHRLQHRLPCANIDFDVANGRILVLGGLGLGGHSFGHRCVLGDDEAARRTLGDIASLLRSYAARAEVLLHYVDEEDGGTKPAATSTHGRAGGCAGPRRLDVAALAAEQSRLVAESLAQLAPRVDIRAKALVCRDGGPAYIELLLEPKANEDRCVEPSQPCSTAGPPAPPPPPPPPPPPGRPGNSWQARCMLSPTPGSPLSPPPPPPPLTPPSVALATGAAQEAAQSPLLLQEPSPAAPPRRVLREARRRSAATAGPPEAASRHGNGVTRNAVGGDQAPEAPVLAPLRPNPGGQQAAATFAIGASLLPDLAGAQSPPAEEVRRAPPNRVQTAPALAESAELPAFARLPTELLPEAQLATWHGVSPQAGVVSLGTQASLTAASVDEAAGRRRSRRRRSSRG